MTVQELSQLFYLEKYIQHEYEQLDALRASLDLQSPGLSDMPKAPGAKDKIGDVVPAIVDKSAEIEAAIAELEKKKNELTRYIKAVPFFRIRLILTLRFIDKKTWMEVAEFMGDKETEYSVKQACYRYVEGTPEPGPVPGQTSMFDA